MAIYKLGDVIKIISGSKNVTSEGSIPIIGSGGVFGMTSDLPTTKNPTFSLPRKGTMEIYWYNEPIFNVDTAFVVENNFNYAYLKYIYYYLLDKSRWSKIINGTTRPATRISDWRNLLVNLPSLYDQKKIIDIIEPIERVNFRLNFIKEKIYFLIKNLRASNSIVNFSQISNLIKNKAKNITQVSAKVMSSRDSFIKNLEAKNTYHSNTFFCPKNTLLINTIRTYLEKFAILPCDADGNGTLAQLIVKEQFQGIALYNLLNNSFWNQCNLLSHGTKMPVLSKKNLFNKVDLIVPQNYLNWKNIFSFLTYINNLVISLNALKDNLINILIN